MHDNRTHPLLAQIPLTVSPFVSLPTAATLPYTYKPMPSTLPPSSSGITTTTTTTDADPSSMSSSSADKPRYVVSASGHAAHPDDIIASCRALQSHVAAMQADAERELADLDRRVRDRELAERRRVAPGWLDSSARLLEPEKKGGEQQQQPSEAGGGVVEGTGSVAGQFAEMSLADRQGACEMAGDLDQGAELDRAFGGK
ncbi:hypothetical protein LQW54_005566 [Pestalotiopsis sp. IQ-011]